MLVHNIGETAGKIWDSMSENGSSSSTVAKLRKDIGADAFTINAAIGWLAREDKVELSKSGNSVKINLK